jgi:2'-5' RNA ligase
VGQKVIRDEKEYQLVADKSFDEKAVRGAWLLLFLSPDDAQEIALRDEGAEPPEKLHVTVGSLDMDTASDKREIVEQVISEAANRLPPVVGKIGGQGAFVSEEKVPVIALFDSPNIQKWRSELENALQAVGVELRNDHGYQPHITLAYSDKPITVPVNDRELELGTLSLVWEGERKDFPLEGNKEQTMKEITVVLDDKQEQVEDWEKEFIADLEDSVKAVTKRVGDQDLPASAFLVVEDPETVTTWHLPVRDVQGNADRRRMGAAWAALHGGYRGKKYAGPNKQEAITKLRKMYEDEEMPLPGTKEQDEKAGRRVRGDRVGLVKKIAAELDDVKTALMDFLGWADYDDAQPTDEDKSKPSGTFTSWLESGAATKALEDAEAHGSSFVAFKAADGSDWLLTFSTNAFEDREGEIFATKAIEEYVARHEDEKTKGEYQFWHLPGSKFGEIHWQGTVGRFLVEAGPFDNTPTGRAFKEFFSANPRGHPVVAPDGWGCSHKYEYKSKDREDGIYDWFEKSETTVLPLDAAANAHTAPVFLGKELEKMNDRQKAALKLIGGDDLVSMVETVGKKATEELEQTVSFKQADYGAMIRKIAANVEDDAVKAQLMKIAGSLGKMKQEKPMDDEEEYPEKKKQDEDEKADDTPAEDKTPNDESSKEMTELAEAVGEGLKAVVEGYQAGDTEIAGAITELTDAVKALQEQVGLLSRDDEEKIAEKAADTPAASLREMVGRAIGDPSTRVDGRKKYGKDRPKETQPIVEGQTGISLIDTFVSGADQRQLTQ